MSVVNWYDSWEAERLEREAITPESICTFGIKALDDILIGMLKKDFIAIGADSGAGKSELCLKIATHNALRNKKVIVFFLEGGDIEAIARIKWDLMRERYYSKNYTGIDFDYRKWRMNLIKDPLVRAIETDCMNIFKEKIQNNLKLHQDPKGISITGFIKEIDQFLNKNTDLILIDHLQYFNLHQPKEEMTEQSQILKKVNEICHVNNIPVILISHLRKKDKERGLPNQEDFYGTSNIPKMSSLSITISSENSEDGIIYPTYFRFVKTRTKISPNFALRSDFNIITGKYSEEYYCYTLYNDKLSENPLTIDKLPRFARNASFYNPKIKTKQQYTD